MNFEQKTTKTAKIILRPTKQTKRHEKQLHSFVLF